MIILKLTVVMALFLSAGVLLTVSIDNNVWAQNDEDPLKYNTFENKWEYAYDDESLKYNPLENESEYAD